MDLPSPQVQRPRVKRASPTATYPVPQSKDTHDGHVTVQQLCQIASAIKCRCCGNVKVDKEKDEIPLAEAYHDSDHEEDKENASPVEQKPEDSNEEDNKTGNIEDLFVGKLSKKPSTENISPAMQLGWPQHRDATNTGDVREKFLVQQAWISQVRMSPHLCWDHTLVQSRDTTFLHSRYVQRQ